MIQDTKTIALIASIISYVLYNVLFLAAQLWPAFATLFLGELARICCRYATPISEGVAFLFITNLGLYYLPICYGYMKKNRSVMIVGTALQVEAPSEYFLYYHCKLVQADFSGTRDICNFWLVCVFHGGNLHLAFSGL